MPKAFLPWLLAFTGALPALAADPALTIYNQNFAVVRDTIPLDLHAGVNQVNYAGTTAHLEPDSVILRDPSGKLQLQVLEQNYRNDPVTQDLLLSLFEGQTINFAVKETGQPDRLVAGKIIRSGYVMHSQEAMQRYGQQYYRGQMSLGSGAGAQPVIEVDGKIQFGLPGEPIFPSLGDDTILKPMLTWQLNADAPGKVDAELAYLTGGMSWHADYNIVAPPDSDLLDIIGWVTMDNQSGKTFQNARIKLMAGDVSKLQNRDNQQQDFAVSGALRLGPSSDPSAVTEKAFDDYHLYSLPRPATLHDGETKQVEFIRASGVPSSKVYVYDGSKVDWDRYGGRGNLQNLRNNDDFDTDSDTKVAVMREFKNSEANHLGMPLPKGRVRAYKQDEAELEFTGENLIDHTPKDELVRFYTGNAFDLVGERQRTSFKRDNSDHWVDEFFTIKLRNHKKDAAEIRVVEHLYRWLNWEISENTDPFVKTNAQEMEFRVQVKPGEEKTVSYKVHYSW